MLPELSSVEDLEPPLMIAVVGRPGTGKTTLARMLATELRAAHLRLDAIQAAVVRSGVAQTSYGLVGYLVAQEVAAGCLAVGTPVVVDSVSAVPNARRGWTRVAERAGATLRMVELSLSDEVEHRRRVRSRVSDIPGLGVPSWDVVTGCAYAPWDESRDGVRLAVDSILGRDQLLAAALEYVRSGRVLRSEKLDIQEVPDGRAHLSRHRDRRDVSGRG
jgi:predicted kinase